MAHVVYPLETLGTIVKLVVTDCLSVDHKDEGPTDHKCSMWDELLEVYARPAPVEVGMRGGASGGDGGGGGGGEGRGGDGGRERLLAVDTTCRSIGQGHNIRITLDLFSAALGRLGMANTSSLSGTPGARPDLVIVTRHDVGFILPITQWAAKDFERTFNFFSRCEERSPYGESCVNDIMHTMPFDLFGKFNDAVGRMSESDKAVTPQHGGCFMEGKNGHECYNVMAKELQEGGGQPKAQGGAHVGFITNWRPRSNVRERSDVTYVYGCKGKGKGACVLR
mmetsp:Transcript_33194/g.87679  ORF Transcript_33194/g.87679 Transcript_33194/m.87679 type:complete len:280 (+) Transcript_33194:821-1660(+)